MRTANNGTYETGYRKPDRRFSGADNHLLFVMPDVITGWQLDIGASGVGLRFDRPVVGQPLPSSYDSVELSVIGNDEIDRL